jgi:hypothetical protein
LKPVVVVVVEVVVEVVGRARLIGCRKSWRATSNAQKKYGDRGGAVFIQKDPFLLCARAHSQLLTLRNH